MVAVAPCSERATVDGKWQLRCNWCKRCKRWERVELDLLDLLLPSFLDSWSLAVSPQRLHVVHPSVRLSVDSFFFSPFLFLVVRPFQASVGKKKSLIFCREHCQLAIVRQFLFVGSSPIHSLLLFFFC